MPSKKKMKPAKRSRSAASGKQAAKLPKAEVVSESREKVYWRGWLVVPGPGWVASVQDMLFDTKAEAQEMAEGAGSVERVALVKRRR